jgi:hypothetical protein
MSLPAACEYEGGHGSGSRPHQSLLGARRLRATAPRRRGEGPKAPCFGAAGAHVRAAGAWRTPRPLSSHSAVGATMTCPSLGSQVQPQPPLAGSAVSTETSLPLPHAPNAAPSDWLLQSSVCGQSQWSPSLAEHLPACAAGTQIPAGHALVSWGSNLPG